MDRAGIAEFLQARAEIERPLRSWLAQPASRGAAELALLLLDDVLRGARRLEDPRDSEALHDFRVAMRRLRATLRAYGEPLAGGDGRRLAADLKSLAAATNRCRDAEVYLTVLGAAAMEAARRPALARIVSRLRAQVAEGHRGKAVRAVEEFVHSVAAARTRLIARSALPGSSGETLAEVLLKSLAHGFVRLKKHLSRIRSKADGGEIHRARIWAKRLRYLIEPFDREIRRGRRTVQSLRGLQELLGELHDAQGLQGFLARNGGGSRDAQLAGILDGLGRRERKLFKQLKRDWLRGRLPLPDHIGLKQPSRWCSRDAGLTDN
jgi:CHAD domain-containing protein